MPSAHCVGTIDGVILSADESFLSLVGRTEIEVVGKSYVGITDPRDLGKSSAMVCSLIAKAPPVRIQKRYLRPDGSSVVANVLTSRFTDPDRLVSTVYWSGADRELPPVMLWEAALSIRHVQDMRRKEFGAELFADCVDGILLELYLAEAEGRVIDVGELSERVPAPPSTTLRWLRHIRSLGLIESSCEPLADVGFTSAGVAKMERMLSSLAHLPDAPSRFD